VTSLVVFDSVSLPIERCVSRNGRTDDVYGAKALARAQMLLCTVDWVRIPAKMPSRSG